MKRILLIGTALLATGAWGPRGHQVANRAAVKALPPDGPVFLRDFEDFIAKTGPQPDSWRAATEPHIKLFEDPNHGWFKEQFAFMQTIPRSRYEFVLRIYDEYVRIKDSDPERAALTNVRWTGTLPYAAIENYDRMKATLRVYRSLLKSDSAESKQDARYLAQDIAFYMGWLGHYLADGAMPIHNSIHHDGWQGDNPKDYTRDPGIHARFETALVEAMKLTDADLTVAKARVLGDPFADIIDYLDDASSHVERLYIMDKRGAYSNPKDAEATALVKSQLSKAAALLRDLTYTAWTGSAATSPAGRAASRNPATGTAPPDGPPIPNRQRK